MIGAVFPSIVGVVPDNWLLLDGTWWPIADYPVLYQRMLGTWESNGTHFQLPDFSGLFVMGADGQGPLGWTGGLASVTLTEQQLPVVTVVQNEHNHTQYPHTHYQAPHNHDYSTPSFNIDVEGPGAPDPTGAGFPMVPAATGLRQPFIDESVAANYPAIATNQPFGGGQDHENRPPFIRLEYYVVAR
jgi:microcystin-dependent protein